MFTVLGISLSFVSAIPIKIGVKLWGDEIFGRHAPLSRG